MSLRASLIYFAARGASGVLSVACVALFARLLGPEGYGRWTLATVLASFLVGVWMQPLYSALARFVAQTGAATVAATLLRVGSRTALGLSAAALTLEGWGPSWLVPGFALAALGLGLAQASFDFSAVFASTMQQPRRYSALFVTKSLAALVLGAALIGAGGGAPAAVAAMILAYLLATSLFGREAWRSARTGAHSPEAWRAWRRYVLPVLGGQITSVALLWSDRLILAASVSAAALGAYGAAGDVAQQAIGLLFGSLNLAWFPRLVAAWEQAREETQARFSRYLLMALALMLPTLVGFCLVADDLARLMLGARFGPDAARWMVLLAMAAFLAGLRVFVLDVPLHLAQRMGWQSAVTALAAGFAIAANLWSVPRWGAMAAAWTAVAAQVLACIGSYVVGRSVLAMRLSLREIVVLATALAALAIAVLAIPLAGNTGLAAKVFAGASAYGLCVLAFDLGGAREALRIALRGRS